MKKRLTALLLTICMLFTMTPVVGAASNMTVSASDENVEITKTAVRTSTPGVYDITLTVDPEVDLEPKPTEIVLVLDISYSMQYCMEEEHEHSSSCGIDCGLSEHRHSYSCYGESTVNCGKQEHWHDDSCGKNYTCGHGSDYHEWSFSCMREDCNGKHHDRDCQFTYTCGLEQHYHTYECYSAPELICTQTEHSHTEECYACGKTEHEHYFDSDDVGCGGTTDSRIYNAGTEMKNLYNALKDLPNTTIHGVTFAGGNSADELTGMPDSIPTSPSDCESGTNYNAALSGANNAFENDNSNKIVIMLSDGEPNSDNYAQSLSALKSKATIYTVAFPEKLTALTNVATSASHAYEASDAATLRAALAEIAEEVSAAALVDDLGSNVVLKSGTLSPNASVEDSDIVWAPTGTVTAGTEQTITYQVTLDADAEGEVALNGDISLEYIANGTVGELELKQYPTDTVQRSDLLVKYYVDDVVVKTVTVSAGNLVWTRNTYADWDEVPEPAATYGDATFESASYNGGADKPASAPEVTADGYIVEYRYVTVPEYTVSFVNSDPNKGTLSGTTTGTYKSGTEYPAAPDTNPAKHFAFDYWADANGAEVENFPATVTENAEYTAVWKQISTDPSDIEPKVAAYKVEHYKENVDGTYSLAETEFPLYGDLGSTVSATAKQYENYSEDTTHADRVPSGTVIMPSLAEGATEPTILVLKLYYKLNTYTVTFVTEDAAKGTLTGTTTGTYKHGQAYPVAPVTVPAEHYAFDGWYDASGMKVETFPATVTTDAAYTAKWKQISTDPSDIEPKVAAYKVEHYKENVDGTYTLAETEFPLYGELNSTVSATAKQYENYSEDTTHADRVPSGTVIMPSLAEGATEPMILTLKMYYSKDAKGGGNEGNQPDNIPDKYQIFVKYAAAANGKIADGATTFEKFDIRDADKAGSKVTAYGSYYAVTIAGSEAAAAEKFAFTEWTQQYNSQTATKTAYAAKIPAGELKSAKGGDTILYTAYFTPKTTPLDPDSKAAGYFTEYYLEKDGEYVLQDKDYAVAKIGTDVKIDAEAVADKYEGYALDTAAEGTKLSGEVYKPSAKDGVLDILTLKLYYSADVISEGKDEETEKSDRIPDKYQVTVLYKSEQGGEIVDIEKEVLTLTDKDGNYVTKADVKASGSEVERDSSKYRFRGWYADSDKCVLENEDDYELDEFWIEEAVGGEIYKLTAEFSRKSSGSSSSKKPALNTEEHFQYIMGYPDGTVGPLDRITRAEVASIFYRLLDDKTREYYFTTENAFPDMNESMWYNKAVSTLANAGIITGCSDGLFHGGRTITRAELATIIAKFDEDIYVGHDFFTDIAGHWARPYINVAAENGWIVGDGNALFRPYDAITRAEVMTMINAVLEREVDADGLCKGYKKWSDNIEGKWYYYQVIEATNYHEYVVEKNDSEKWIKILEDKTWDEAGIK